MEIYTLAVLFAFFINPYIGSYIDSHPGGKRVKIFYLSTEGRYREMEASFRVPNEPGWLHMDTSRGNFDYHSVLLKKNISPNENEEIEFYMIEYLRDYERQPDSIDNIIQKKTNDINKYYESVSEYKLHDLDVTEYLEKNKKYKCVRTHILLEDMRIKENEPQRWSEQHALSCSFPVRPRYTFELRYYQRYYDYNKDHLFASKADKLFESVKIKDNINISIIAYTFRMSFYDNLHHQRGEYFILK